MFHTPVMRENIQRLPDYANGFLNSNTEMEFLRWWSAAVPAAATCDGQAVGKCSVT
jgi:hypothetical protein